MGLGSQDVKSVQKLIRDPQRTNSYSYSRNNPINLYDPDGRSFWGFMGNALDSVARASDAAFDFVSFGAVSEARTMATEGVTAGGVAHVVAGVVGGAVVTTLAAVDVGMAAGGLAIDIGASAARTTSTVTTATRASTLEPGPYAQESIPAPSAGRSFSTQTRNQINNIGNEFGCHTCGADSPGTKSGNWIPDHQPPTALNPQGNPQKLFPHCSTCSHSQGGWISQIVQKATGEN